MNTTRGKPYIYPSYPYKESQFTAQDYHILFDIATPLSNVRSRVKKAKFRDKKFQRYLNHTEEYMVFSCPFDQLPLHLNTEWAAAKDILKWRLRINK